MRILAGKISVFYSQQLSLLLLVVVLLWLSPLDSVVAKSVLVGGLIHWWANVYFALLAFRYQGAANMPRILKNIYRGELGKAVLVALGFALAFTHMQSLDPMLLFGAFIGMTLLQYLSISAYLRSATRR